MAPEVVISEVLCFTSNNSDKLTVNQLKPIMLNFYNDPCVAPIPMCGADCGCRLC